MILLEAQVHCATSGMFFSLSGPQFPHLPNGYINFPEGVSHYILLAILVGQGGARGHGVKGATWKMNCLGIHRIRSTLTVCAQGEQVPGEERRAVDLLLSPSLLLLPT